MNEESVEHARTFCLCVHATLSLSLFISPSLSLTTEQGAHTLFTGQRERGRERKRKREREKEREGEREREREREKEREGEREREQDNEREGGEREKE
jgi:hypothetical protein